MAETKTGTTERKEEAKNKETEDSSKEKKKFIIDALDIHGSFFHKKCIEIISDMVAFRVIEKEFPVDLNGELTKIDIVAERDAGLYNSFIIECKKVDNNFKSWVFFPDIQHHVKDASAVLNKAGKSPIIFDALADINYGTPSKFEFGLLRNFSTPKDGEDKEIENPVCYDGYQIKLDTDKEGKLNKNNIHKSAKKEDIEKACNQVLLGSRGYALYLLKKMKTVDPKFKKAGLFIPIIVTTAKILVCNIESKNISLKEGITINQGETELKEVPWIVYNYKPNFMLNDKNQIPFFNSKKDFNENASIDYIMSVYIVNSEKLTEFLHKIQWIK